MDDSSDVKIAAATATSALDSSSVAGETDSISIMPTKSYSVATSTVGQTSLQTSSDVPYSDSTQFPMQHATKVLPSNQVPIATTDPVTLTSDEVQGQTTQSQLNSQSGLPQSSQSTVAGSSSEVNDISASDSVKTMQSAKSVIPTKSTDIQSVNAGLSDSLTVSDETVSSDLVDDSTPSSDGNKSVIGVTKTVTDSVYDTDSVLPLVTSTDKLDILPSSSESPVVVVTAAVHSTDTPTTFSSGAQSLDTMAFQTTKVVPLPQPTGKPMVPETSADSTILGGGLSDNIIYIGVPLCGVGILILLILCIVCIRRRKSKAKGSPAKNRVQDLWVNNSRQDIPLTSRSPGPEQNGGEAALQDDIGCTTYEAVFDYKGELSTHLQLKQGDLVRVHRKEAAGWWRGTAGDQSGWFPSNYVQAAPPDNFKNENEIEMLDDSHVTSFMVKKSDEPNHRQSYIINEPNQRHSYITDEPNHRTSTPTEEEIQAEPIYCKIQHKDKRKSGTDRSNSTTPTKSEVLSPSRDSFADTDKHYVALYPFVARVETELTINKGDIILCKECTGKNGWMRGINDSTKHEGWVPATYVKKVEILEKPKFDLDPSSYKQLEVNTDMDEQQDLVGIVHKAVHTFSAEKAGDLEFDTGDLITVFQVLENGWWLGCKDKTVGWFPGTFVEMIDQPSSSPSPSSASSNQSPSQSPVPSEESQSLSDDISKLQTPSVTKQPSQSKLKPVRKAPAPPTPRTPKTAEANETANLEPNKEKKPESKLPTPGSSRLPKMSRPKVAPPLPPTKHTPDHQESPLYESIDKNEQVNDVNKNISEIHVPNDINSVNSKQNGPTSDGLYDLIKQPDNTSVDVPIQKKDKIKPPVPKRYIKPKLVTVPKTDVQMPNKDTLTKGLVNGDVMKLRPPPPPRPVAPKLGPIRAKLAEPKPLEDQIPSVEEDTFFNVTPQRKFDAFVCQDLNEQETVQEEDPYHRLSSFGSFGVSSFGKPKENKNLPQIDKSKSHVRQVENEHDKIIDDDSWKIVDDNSVAMNAKVNNEKEQKDVHHKEFSAEIKNSQADVVQDKTNEQTDQQIDINSNAKTEPKAKTGIPVTPKTKLSRLAPPRSVSIKADESLIKEDSDHTASSPVEKASKLQKPTKVIPCSKIPLSPKESPKKKIEDSHLFQYPDTLENAEVDTTLQRGEESVKPEKNYSGEKHMVKDDAILATAKCIKPPTEILDKRPRTESFETKPQEENVENRPRKQSVESRPRQESLEKMSYNNDNRPKTESIESRQRTDSFENRPRTDSIGKPPVAPKPKSGLPKLAKPKSISKGREENIADNTGKEMYHTEEDKPGDNYEKPQIHGGKPRETEDEIYHVASPTVLEAKTRLSESESDTDNRISEDKPKSVSPGSKLPLGSALAQPSPKSRGRKSNLPSPGFRNKSVDKIDKTSGDRKLSESENEGPVSPKVNLRQKSESPRPARKAPSKQIGSVEKQEKQSLRNRSNSPAGRTGIPTTIRNRSNSPAPKPAGIPLATTTSPSSKSTPKNKQRGLVPPKKILNGLDKPEDNTKPDSRLTGSPSPVIEERRLSENDNTSPKPDRPSKPPRVQKQKSKDGRPPKHGKSLLPVIHKAMDTGNSSPNGVSPTTPGTKPKRGIPVAKSARSPAPKDSPTDHSEDMKKTLYQAVRGYTAQIDGELTFSEGTFVKELSDCDRPGWYVGMLADGTTGLYPSDHFKPSPVSAQSEA